MYRLIIVDDEENILKALNRVLGREKDLEIESYSSSTDALRRIQVVNFELFLSDYRMPEIDGVEFLTRAKELQPESVRLILSGYTDLQALLGAINEAEIFRFISKPWQDYELITTVRQALAHRDMIVENRRLADQVRRQQQELDKRKSALEKLSASHPELVHVDWAPDGSILLDEAQLRV